MGYYASGNGTFVLRLKDDDVFDGVGLNLLTREQVEEVICDHFEDTDIYDVTPPGTSSSPQTSWSVSFGGKYYGDVHDMLSNLCDSLVEFSGDFTGEDDYRWRTAMTPDGRIENYGCVSVHPSDPRMAETELIAALVKEHAEARGVSVEDTLGDIGTALGATVSAL